MINFTLNITNTDNDPAVGVTVTADDPTVVIAGGGALGSVAAGETRVVTATKEITLAMEGTTDVTVFTASGAVDGEPDMASVAIAVAVPAPPLIFRQDVSTGPAYFATFDEAINFPDPNPATAARYSRLSQLEDLRNADGLLHFRLVYPQTDDVFEWTQQSNPLTAPADTVAGFSLISATASASQFGGLANSGGAAGVLAFFNGMPGTPNWFAAIAASADWPATPGDDFPGLPVSPTTFTQVAELYIIGSVNDPVPPTANPPVTGGAAFSDEYNQRSPQLFAAPTADSAPLYTPDQDVLVSSVDLNGGSLTGSWSAALEIRQGASLTGPVIATSDVVNESQFPFGGTTTFPFPTPAALTAGQTYTFTLTPDPANGTIEYGPDNSIPDPKFTAIIAGVVEDRGAVMTVTGTASSSGPVPFTESRLQGAGNGQATGTQITQPVYTPDRQMEIRTVQLSVAGGLFGTSTDTTVQMRQGANATGAVLATSGTLPLTGGIGPRVFTFPPGVVVPAGIPVTFTSTNPSPGQQWEIDPIGSDFYPDTNLLETTSGLTDRGAPMVITGFEV